MKALYSLKQQDKAHPLLGAHVLSVAAAIEYGVVPREFKVLEVEPRFTRQHGERRVGIQSLITH